MNGAAAHRVKPGDVVIIASFVQVELDRAAPAGEAPTEGWEAIRVFVDDRNQIRA